jgi:hypothetical protein
MDIQNQTEGNRLRWFRQVKRIDEHSIPKKITGNEDEWKDTQWHVMNTVARQSQERQRKKRKILEERRRSAGMDR